MINCLMHVQKKHQIHAISFRKLNIIRTKFGIYRLEVTLSAFFVTKENLADVSYSSARWEIPKSPWKLPSLTTVCSQNQAILLLKARLSRLLMAQSRCKYLNSINRRFETWFNCTGGKKQLQTISVTSGGLSLCYIVLKHPSITA
jgi:hypothetical protein